MDGYDIYKTTQSCNDDTNITSCYTNTVNTFMCIDKIKYQCQQYNLSDITTVSLSNQVEISETIGSHYILPNRPASR